MTGAVAALRRHSNLQTGGLAGLGALTLFAYRGLAGYDPAAGLRLQVEGTEGLLFDPAAGSPLLIFAVTAWMLWSRRGRLSASMGDAPQRAAAGVLLTAALALALWAHYVDATDLLIPSLSLTLLGAGALIGGGAGRSALLLPAGFLLLAMPIPASLLNEIMFPLQMVTAHLTAFFLKILGIPVLLYSDQILARERIFQVIETCSGLRLIETLIMAALVYGELLSRSRLHRFLLLLIAPAVGVLVNGARVLSIVLNPYSEFAAIHTSQGIVMLLVGVFMLAGIDWLLEISLRRRSRERGAVPAARVPFPTARLPIFGAYLAALCLASVALPHWTPPPTNDPPLSRFPIRMGDWKVADGLPLDQQYLGSVRFSEWMHRRYSSPLGDASILLGSDKRLERAMSFRSAKTAIPGSGWVLLERGRATLGPDGRQVESLVFRSRGGTALVYHWYEGVRALPLEVIRELFALDRGPFRRPGRALAVRLSVPIPPTLNGRAEAETSLGELAPVVRAALRELGLEPAPGSTSSG